MVSVSEQTVVAQPNRSANWRQNQWIIVGISLWCLLVAIAFSLAGAWLILPVAGLEMAALACSLYFVCWKLQHQHIIKFQRHQLIIEKGRYAPQQVWVFNKSSIAIAVERRHHPWDPIKLSLCGRNRYGSMEQISVGDFLNKNDSKKLLAALRQKGLSVRNDSLPGIIEF